MVNLFYWRELDCKSLQGYLKPRLNKLPKKKNPSKFLKAVFHKFYLDHICILRPIYALKLSETEDFSDPVYTCHNTVFIEFCYLN